MAKIALIVCCAASCCFVQGQMLVDREAIPAVRHLYQALLDILEMQEGSACSGIRATMFGHQDDLAYGYTWRYVPGGPLEDPPQSDVFFSTNKTLYPKVFGFDIGNIWKADGLSVDQLRKDDIARYVRRAHAMGGVITMTMHNDNPMTGKSAWDNETGTVASILQGGDKHEHYLRILDSLAGFLESLAPIPILFRPYHEANEYWSWWGFRACSASEYSQLWRMTVDFFLQRPHWGHNLLFVISPQDPSTVGSGDENSQEYFSRYPGDDYVDVLGFDAYRLWENSSVLPTGQTLKDLVSYSSTTMHKRGHMKPVAITEAGTMYPRNRTLYPKKPYGPPSWWTKYLGRVLQLAEHRLAWALVWRNPFNYSNCFAPSPTADHVGVCEVENFQAFVADGRVQLLPYSTTRRLRDHPLLV